MRSRQYYYNIADYNGSQRWRPLSRPHYHFHIPIKFIWVCVSHYFHYMHCTHMRIVSSRSERNIAVDTEWRPFLVLLFNFEAYRKQRVWVWRRNEAKLCEENTHSVLSQPLTATSSSMFREHDFSTKRIERMNRFAPHWFKVETASNRFDISHRISIIMI